MPHRGRAMPIAIAVLVSATACAASVRAAPDAARLSSEPPVSSPVVPPPPATGAVLLADLEKVGISLSPVQHAPQISESQAQQIAGGSVYEALLRHVREGTEVSLDAWVVSVVPFPDEAAGPPGSSPAPETFSVVIIDARTGRVIDQYAGS